MGLSAEVVGLDLTGAGTPQLRGMRGRSDLRGHGGILRRGGRGGMIVSRLCSGRHLG